MKKTIRVILLAVLLSTIAFFIFWNMPSQKLKKKITRLVEKINLIYPEIDKISAQDLERYNKEKELWNKLETFIYKENQIAVYDPVALEKLIKKNSEPKEIIKLHQRLLTEMVFLKSQIKDCRRFLKQIKLDRQNRTEDYRKLLLEANRVLNYLTYFSINYTQALKLNQETFQNLVGYIIYENPQIISEHIERYFKHSAVFKDLYLNSMGETKALHEKILNKNKIWEKNVPGDKDKENIISELQRQNTTLLYKLQADLTGNGTSEFALVLKSSEETYNPNYFLKIYTWEDKKFKLIFNKDLGTISSYEYKDKQTTLPIYEQGLRLKYSSLIPELILIYNNYSTNWDAFKYNGRIFEEIY